MKSHKKKNANHNLEILNILIFLAGIVFSKYAFAETHYAEIKSYVKTERYAGRVPDLKAKFGLDFSGANFSKLDLSNVDFSNTKLRDANFISSDLYGANLSGTDLYLAKFIETGKREGDSPYLGTVPFPSLIYDCPVIGYYRAKETLFK